MSIVWGVRAFYIDPDNDAAEAIDFSIRTLKHKKLIADGDVVLHVSSLPIFDFQGVNTIKLGYV
ncbi:hypothetical protein ES705_20045 [subsurface metagenome]